MPIRPVGRVKGQRDAHKSCREGQRLMLFYKSGLVDSYVIAIQTKMILERSRVNEGLKVNVMIPSLMRKKFGV